MSTGRFKKYLRGDYNTIRGVLDDREMFRALIRRGWRFHITEDGLVKQTFRYKPGFWIFKRKEYIHHFQGDKLWDRDISRALRELQ